MVKLFIDRVGSNIALGVEGYDEVEIQQRLNSFLNFGAVLRGQPIRLSETLWYVWTTPERFQRYLVNAALFKLLGDTSLTAEYKGQKGGLMPLAREVAKTLEAEYESRPFIVRGAGYEYDAFACHTAIDW